ncbi:MAG: carboxypeptidase regulatory-like domain-containing protein [Candidatus Acidiferrales bacterium]
MRFRVMSVWMLTALLATLVCIFTAQVSRAQDVFGTINGTVTDSTGAAVSGASVTITNEQTGIARPATTNENGYFVAAELPVGVYTVAATQKGFKVTTKSGNDVAAGDHVTVDLALQIGQATETIQVSATGLAVNQTSAEIASTVDTRIVVNLALNERNYVQLSTLIPGAPVLQGNFDQTAFTTGQGLNPSVINGQRGDGNLWTVDGGYNMDSGSNASQVNNVGIDFVQEVNIQTSNYDAEYGRSNGASINVVTKSGGDRYHGTLFEYVRNNVFDARNALQSSTGNTPAQIVPELRFNDFGGDVGGPVIKHKLFIFFGMEAKRLLLPGDGTINLTVPTTAELMGNFADTGETLQAKGAVANSCIGTYGGGTTFMPSGTGTGNAINPSCITGAGAATAKVYSLLETPGATPLSASSFADTATTNNAVFTPSTPQNWEEDVVRADYHPSQNHSMYFRSIHDHLLLVDPFGIFGPGHGSALPTSPSLRNRPGYDFQLADVWTANTHFINEAKLTVAWNKQRIPVTGNLWQESTYGFTNGTGGNYQEPFGNVGPYPTGIPTLNINGGTCSKNNCPAEVYGPYNYLLAPTSDVSPTDNVTYSWRNHTFRFGALYARNRKDQNSRQQSPEGNVTYSNASGNPNTTGDQFADALLGNYNSYTQLSADPVGHYRFNDWGTYAADDWKVTHSLSLDLGLRWDYTVPTYTQANNLAFFDPSAYVPGLVTVPNVPSSSPLSNVPMSVGTGLNLDCPGPPNSVAPAGPCNSGGYVVDGVLRTGNVPTDQLIRVTNGLSPFVTSVGASSERGFFKPEGLFGPRVGIAWAINEKTVIRAGYGVFYDKPEGNLVFGNTGVVPFVQSVSYTQGNLGTLPASGATPTINSTTGINPDLRVARDQQYSLSVQRELPDGILFQAAYVGDHGWHELREPDVNVPTFAAAAADGTAVINSVRPYLGFIDPQVYESDGISNYNALQVSATKTKGDSSFQLAYTWSKTLSTGAGLGDNLYPECAFTCTNAAGQSMSWQKYWYGPTTLDIPQVFVASYTLNEPFFKNLRGVEGGFLSHWTLSGITRLQSGQALTVTGSGALESLGGGTTFTNRANIVSGVGLVNSVAQGGASFGSGACPATKICYVNAAAFGASEGVAGSVPTTSMGNAPLGDIFGPGYYGWDLSLRKVFPIRESMNVTFQWDAFNAFNRVNYSNPGTTITSSTFGEITGANPPRQMQFGLKFAF